MLLVAIAGCSPLWAGLSRPAPAEVEDRVSLHDSDEGLRLHLASGPRPSAPLIVYATGDTGWHDHDEALFRTLSRWGHPVAGVSAPEFVDHLGSANPAPGSGHVAEDFAAIVARAEATLGLPPSTPIVLVGISRGAGLAVAVGSAPVLGSRLVGILAIALTREEENVRTLPPDDDAGAEPAPMATYDILPSLGRTRVAVIQSTHDEYVTAAEARQLFGPDTASRRLRAIDSRDHGFDGAHAALEREMKRSFDWIVRR